MNTLIINYETISNGFSDITLPLLSLLAITSGILVIVTKNPIISVLYLIGLFLSIALYLISLGINFIGISYLLVYVGAISILFIFILMLINIRVSELLSETSKSIPLAIITSVMFNYLSLTIIPNNIYYAVIDSSIISDQILIKNILDFIIIIPEKINSIMLVTSNIWDGSMGQVGHIITIGSILYTNLSILLILTSIILLLAMVGAIIITLSPKTSNKM